MPASPMDVVRQFIDEVWNQQRMELVPVLIHPQYRVDSRPVETGWVCENVISFHSAFANLHLTIIDSVADDEVVATLVRIQGIHVETWKGIPASGRKVDYREAAFWRVLDGKIVSGAFVAESLTLRVELGQIPDSVWRGKTLT